MPESFFASVFAGGLMLFFLFYLLVMTIVVASTVIWVIMLVDVVKRDFPNQNDKIVWVILLIFTQFLGAIIYYFLIKAKDPHSKKQEWLSTNNIVTLVALIVGVSLWVFGLVGWLLSLVGLILVWTRTKWPNAIKIIVTIIYSLVLIAILGFWLLMSVLATKIPASSLNISPTITPSPRVRIYYQNSDQLPSRQP